MILSKKNMTQANMPHDSHVILMNTIKFHKHMEAFSFELSGKINTKTKHNLKKKILTFFFPDSFPCISFILIEPKEISNKKL